MFKLLQNINPASPGQEIQLQLVHNTNLHVSCGEAALGSSASKCNVAFPGACNNALHALPQVSYKMQECFLNASLSTSCQRHLFFLLPNRKKSLNCFVAAFSVIASPPAPRKASKHFEACGSMWKGAASHRALASPN